MTYDLLDMAGLHAAARDRDSLAPEPFRQATSAVTEARRAYREAVAARNDLVREARAVNVPYLALERWTGISARTLHDIVNGES